MPLVWVVIPELRTVRVHRADRTSVTLHETDEREGTPVLPQFRCRVADLFR